MNTLGNMLLEPREALLIMDFQQGAALHIHGRVEHFWTLVMQRILRLRQLLPAARLALEYADSSLEAGDER